MSFIYGCSDSMEDRTIIIVPWIKRILCEHTNRYTNDTTGMQCHVNVQ